MNYRARFTLVRWLAPLVGASLFAVGAGRAEASPDVSINVVVLDDVLACDQDGYLDSDEVGRAVVTVQNLTPHDVYGARVSIKGLTPEVAVEADGELMLAKLPAFGSGWVETELKLVAKPDGELGLRVEFLPPTGVEMVREAVDAYFPADIDDVAQGATYDDASGPLTAWSSEWRPEYGATSAWRQGLDENSNPVWFVEGGEQGTDSVLVSPPMQPAHGQDFVFSFAQRYDLGDWAEGIAGAVVEMSTDGGRSWRDVYEYIEVPYNGSMSEHASALECRRAFMGQSAGLPAQQRVALDFGTTFEGETLQFRFRMAAEGALKGVGWELDDFEVEGAAYAPFPSRVAHRGQCLPAAAAGNLSGVLAQAPGSVGQPSYQFPSAPTANSQVGAAPSAAQVYELALPEAAENMQVALQAESTAVPSVDVVTSGFGRVYGGQVAASGCTAVGGPEAATPFALVLILVGGAALSRRRK